MTSRIQHLLERLDKHPARDRIRELYEWLFANIINGSATMIIEEKLCDFWDSAYESAMAQHPEEIPVERNRAFVEHLQNASSVVQAWPAQKQEILGGTSVTKPSEK
jgi:hypothetical protein